MSGLPPVVLGLCFGLALAAPIGPVNVICLRRSLDAGFRAGLAAGAGAALADALYALAAALGAGAFAGLAAAHAPLLRIAGGVVLLGFAVVLWRHEPRRGEGEARPVAHGRGIAATFLLTLGNPLPALSLGAAFGLSGATPERAAASAPFVLGVLVGSMLWWSALAAIACQARRRLAGDALRAVQRASAVLLSLFGLAALAAGA